MATPTDLTFHKASRELEVTFDDGFSKRLPAEYLRVFSPSAEVRGHGPGQEVLVFGKEDVSVDRIEPVGNYAVKLIFSDGHDTGIYSWENLYELATQYEENWQSYLMRLEEAGVQRKA